MCLVQPNRMPKMICNNNYSLVYRNSFERLGAHFLLHVAANSCAVAYKPSIKYSTMLKGRYFSENYFSSALTKHRLLFARLSE